MVLFGAAQAKGVTFCGRHYEPQTSEVRCFEPVPSLRPLTKLRQLRVLYLYDGKASLAPLARVSGLRLLDLRGSKVPSLAPLKALQQLSILKLTLTNVNDLTPLTEMKGLKHLVLIGSNVTDLTPLFRMKSLSVLELSPLAVPKSNLAAFRQALPTAKVIQKP